MVWLLVWTLLIIAITTILALYLQSYRTRRKAFAEALAVHRKRTRKIYGCIECGKELLPGSIRLVCGTCPEEYSLCEGCHRRGRPQGGHEHRLYRESIDWEVDPSAIGAAKSAAGALAAALRTYPTRACLGWRERTAGGGYGDYLWLSYAEVLRRSLGVATGLAAAGVRPREVVLLFGANSVEWYLAQYGCFLGCLIVVPQHASTAPAPLAHVLSRARPACVIASVHLRTRLARARALASYSLPLLVLLDDSPDPYALAAETTDTASDQPPAPLSEPRVLAFADVLHDGLTRMAAGTAAPAPPDLAADDLAMLLPTSGTSGQPKLTMVTDGMLLVQARPPDFGVPLAMLTTEPLRQSLDVLAKGGRIGVYSGSLDRLSADLKCLRPTVYGATPTFWAGLHHQFLAELAEAKQKARPDETAGEIETRLMTEWRNRAVLGPRCRLAIIGGAASSPALRKWLFQVLGCVVVDGYGTTETGGLASNQDPRAGTSVQLIDCPELGYLTSDQPHPRGEVVAHTGRMTPGYYGDEAATAESFATIGGVRYFRTGDVGQLVGGEMQIIDRRSAVFKLAQGVFVAPAPLELLYGRSELVRCVFVHGEAAMHAVVAAVVPSVALPERGPEAEARLLADFRRLAKTAGRAAWEVPQLVVVEADLEWTPENGLLSSIGKPCRPALRQRYAPLFAAALAATAAPVPATTASSSPSPSSAAASSSSGGGGSQLSAGVRQVLLASLPSLRSEAALAPADALSLADLGADSMALARLAQAVRERFDVALTVPQLAKLPSLLHLQLAIFGGGAGLRQLFDAVSAPASGAVDWAAEAQSACAALEPDLKAALAAHKTSAPADEGAILLTGATGFFGAFLLHALLHSPAHAGRRIVCIARAASDAEARERVVRNLAAYGLLEEAAPAAARLEVLAGDLALGPACGLTDAAYGALVQRVRLVVHNAAVVNSALPYSALRAPNVAATAHTLLLAARASAPFVHVSTIGLLAGSGVLSEQAEVPPVALRLLSGYAQSKWVAERLVQRAFALGLPAIILRPGTLAGHSRSGSCNPHDTVSRVLLGLVREGGMSPIPVRPAWRQRPVAVCCADEDGCPLPRTYALVPTDWAANATVRLATGLSAAAAGNTTPADPSSIPVYHLVSRTPQSLSDLVSAVREAGVPLATVPAAEFRARMAHLAADHPLFVFASVLSTGGFASASPDPATMPVDACTRAALPGPDGACPLYNQEMLVRMVQFARRAPVP